MAGETTAKSTPTAEPTPEPTSTPSEVEIYLAELEAEVVGALEAAYGAGGFDEGETRMVGLLAEAYEQLHEFFRPNNEEVQLLLTLYPIGIDELQEVLLETLYVPRSTTPMGARLRTSFLTSPISQCVTPDLYGHIASSQARPSAASTLSA